jgi:molybdate transport system ATP-binding protein
MTGGSAGGLACAVQLRLGQLDLDVELAVAPGELVVLVGPNGAGKSTLLRAIAGLQAVDDGRIELDGELLDDAGSGRFVPARQRSVGVVFQDRLLFDRMTVVDNVAFGLRSRGFRRRDAHRAAMHWLERLGLAELAQSRPAQLSGGQAQRVALGRALAFEPRLLLLDEPFSALDATTRVEVRRDLRRHLATLDIPRIIVTHDPVDAITLADRIVVLEAGRVTQHGRPEDLRSRPRSRYVADFIGVNLLRGTMRDGVMELPGGQCIAVVDDVDDVDLQGEVTATIHPRAITLHRARPAGSARNVWATTVDDLDDEGDRVRVRVGSPVPLVVEITSSARLELALEAGAQVWVSFKATEVIVEPD